MQDRPKKKVRVDTRGKRLGDVLPAPKGDSVLGGGFGAGTGAVRFRTRQPLENLSIALHSS